MLKLIAASVLALGAGLSFPAFGQEVGTPPAAPGARFLSDPTYLPLRGQVVGDSTYGYSWSHASSATDLGARSSNDGHGSTISQSFEYGLTDYIALAVSDSYEWMRGSRDTQTVSNDVTHRDGFTDPTFGATWRILDTLRRSPVDLDVSASYAPDIIRSEAAGTDQHGSVARGGDALTLRGAVGYVMPYVTVQGVVQGTRFGRANTDREGDVYLDQSSYWQPSLGLRTQFRTRSPLSFNVDGTYDFRTHSNYNLSPSDLAYRVDSDRRGILGGSVNYQFVPNRLVASVGYNHTFKNDADTNFASNLRLDYQTERTANSATASLLYAF